MFRDAHRHRIGGQRSQEHAATSSAQFAFCRQVLLHGQERNGLGVCGQRVNGGGDKTKARVVKRLRRVAQNLGAQGRKLSGKNIQKCANDGPLFRFERT